MTRNSPKKQTLLFIIGSAINLALFCLSKYTAFPLWLDYTGTLYITALCGPMFGFLSFIIHTALLVTLIDGWTAIIAAIPILFVCFIGYLFGKEDDKSLQGGLAAAFLALVSAFVSSTAVFYCVSSLPHRYSSYTALFETVINDSGKFFGAVTIASVTTLTEVLLMLVLFAIAWLITPKSNETLIFKK